MEDIFWYFILVGIGFSIYYGIKKFNQNTKHYTHNIRNTILKMAFQVIYKNRTQLGFQRRKSIYTDDYGKEDLTKWYEKEIPYFIKHHIYSKLNQEEINYVHTVSFEIAEEIERISKKEKVKKIVYNGKMDGFEFEIFCADKLRKEGWNVRKTKNGADQGVDLIIEKGKRKIAVQCKKYGSPIGNKAVQEVKTGINYYNLNEGIVLANNRFTKSAIELANSNDIKLVHYLETKQYKKF